MCGHVDAGHRPAGVTNQDGRLSHYFLELGGSDEMEEETGGATEAKEDETTAAAEQGPNEDEFVGPPAPNHSEDSSMEMPSVEADYSQEVEDAVDYSQMATFEDENDR